MNDSRSGRVVRVNRFSVPKESREQFVQLLERTHDVIRAQPGLIDEMILEQQSGPGIFNLMTVLQFEGEHVLQSIITAVARADQAAGIDRQALTRSLGVEASVAFYKNAMSDALIPA